MKLNIHLRCKPCDRRDVVTRTISFDHNTKLFDPEIVHVGCKLCRRTVRTKLEFPLYSIFCTLELMTWFEKV